MGAASAFDVDGCCESREAFCSAVEEDGFGWELSVGIMGSGAEMSTKGTRGFRDDDGSGLAAMLPGSGSGDDQPSQNERARW